MDYELVKLRNFKDERGNLVTIEKDLGVPFDIKRVYYIFGNKSNLRRGFHSHKKLKQVLICVSGSCTIHIDDGYETKEVLLNDPTVGLFLDNNIWREMYDFSSDAVLVVLASEIYQEEDYIRNYEEFLEFVKINKD